MENNINERIVEFSTESANKKLNLEALWKPIIDCFQFSKNLVSIGQYVYGMDHYARLAIEGYDENAQGFDRPTEIYAEKDYRCYCDTCHRYMDIKKGDRLPSCCGKPIDVL